MKKEVGKLGNLGHPQGLMSQLQIAKFLQYCLMLRGRNSMVPRLRRNLSATPKTLWRTSGIIWEKSKYHACNFGDLFYGNEALIEGIASSL